MVIGFTFQKMPTLLPMVDQAPETAAEHDEPNNAVARHDTFATPAVPLQRKSLNVSASGLDATVDNFDKFASDLSGMCEHFCFWKNFFPRV